MKKIYAPTHDMHANLARILSITAEHWGKSLQPRDQPSQPRAKASSNDQSTQFKWCEPMSRQRFFCRPSRVKN